MPHTRTERDESIDLAHARLAQSVALVAKEFELSASEVCLILSSAMTRWAGYAMRDQRDFSVEKSPKSI